MNQNEATEQNIFLNARTKECRAKRKKKTAEPSTAMPNNNSERVGCTDMNDM